MNENSLKNLKPFSERPKEERVEWARKAGIASGEAKRKKKKMQEMLEACLDTKNEKGITYRQLVTMGLIKGAIKGNAQNYRAILETLGELKSIDEESKSNGVLIELMEALNNAKKDR